MKIFNTFKLKFYISCVSLTLLFSNSINAQTYTIVQDGNWSNSSFWGSNGVPSTNINSGENINVLHVSNSILIEDGAISIRRGEFTVSGGNNVLMKSCNLSVSNGLFTLPTAAADSFNECLGVSSKLKVLDNDYFSDNIPTSMTLTVITAPTNGIATPNDDILNKTKSPSLLEDYFSVTNNETYKDFELKNSLFFIDESLKQANVLSQKVVEANTPNTYHVFSHGRSGELLIDGQWLNAQKFATWIQQNNLLQNKVQLNIYGCEFAKDEKGKKAVAYLTEQLNISVAASKDVTGVDGDWDLEVGKSKGSLSIADYQYNLQTCGNTNAFGYADDLIQAGFHSALYKRTTGYSVTGHASGPTGATITSLTEVEIANGYNYTGFTDNIYLASSGSDAAANHQYVALASNGDIIAWGDEGVILDAGLTSGDAFDVTTLSLPTGVAVGDVKEFVATLGTLVLLTNSGTLYTTGDQNTLSVSSTTWNEVTSPTNFDDVDVAWDVIFARTTAGALYTWGTDTYLGDGSVAAARTTPTPMNAPPLPGGESIVQIAVSHDDDYNVSYHVLASNGKIYALGENAQGMLGIGSTTTQTNWVTVQNQTGTGDLTNIIFISATDNDDSNVGVSAILDDNTLLSWGENSSDMIGGDSDPVTLPEIPNGFVQGTNFAIYVENGGHITPYINSDGGICNVGHNQDGGFGDGTTDDRTSYSCITVPGIGDFCGFVAVGSVTANDDMESTLPDTPVSFNPFENDLGPIDPSSVVVNDPSFTNATNGTVTVNAVTGEITYTPNPGFEGVDVFEYVVCSDIDPLDCDTAMVTVTVSSCPVGGTDRTVSGTVFNDANSNATNDTEAGVQGVDVLIYHDVNQDGLVDTGDILLSTETTDINGEYSYTVPGAIKNYAENFSGSVFSGTNNNSGTDNWANDVWVKDVGAGSANESDVQAGSFDGSGNDFGSDRVLELNDDRAAAYREVDLTLASSALFSFEFDMNVNVDGGEGFSVQISTDNGANYTDIYTYVNTDGDSPSPQISVTNIDIGSFISLPGSATSRLRIITNTEPSDSEDFWFDNINLDVVESINDFVMVTDGSTYPTGATLTTDNIETASTTETLCHDMNNDFGLSIIDPCDAAASGNTDTDGDNVSDICDLDDDNDGILDVDEGHSNVLGAGIHVQCDTGDIKKFNHLTNVWDTVCSAIPYNGDLAISPTGEIYVCDYVSGSVTVYRVNSDCTTTQVATTTATGFGAGLSFLPDGRIVLGTNLNGILYQVDIGTGVISSYGNIGIGNYVNGDLVVQNNILYYTVQFSSSSINLVSQPLDASFNPTGTATLIGPVDAANSIGLSVDANGNVLGLGAGDVLENISLTTGATGASTVPTYGCFGVGASSVFDADGIGCLQDTDGDGICDYLDLDSDGDGCPDALEGDGGILATQVDGTGAITGGVDANGVPDLATAGQGDVSSTNPAITGGQCDDDGDGVINESDICNGFDDAADNDTDGVPDGCDLDDDNDGILDTVENPCGTQVTNAWTGSGDTFTGTGAANNATVSFTHGPNSEITYSPTGTHNSLALWSNPSVESNTSFEMLFVWDTNPEALSSNAADDADTATMTITYAQPVLNPIIHIERLGGSGRSGSIYLSNSTEFTLVTPGLSMNKLSGNNQLIVESNKFYRAPFLNLGSANPGGGSDLTSTSTGAGSIQVNGVVTTVTFSLTGIGVEGTGRDGIEFSFEACTAIDTDNDGIPDYLDLDSDGDGCPDAIEGGGTFTPADLVTSAIDGGNNNDGSTTGTYTGTVTDSVQLNLGASSNDDGTPNLDGNTATSESQATAPAVTDSGTNACVADLNLIKTVDKAIPKIGDTIVYTLTVKNDGPANATGVQVTDVLPTGITYVSHTVSTTGTTFTDSDADVIRDLWNIGDMAVNQTISLQITGTVSGAGTIVNAAEITQSNQTDSDSTPGNGQ